MSPQIGPVALSERKAHTVALVAQGLSNAEIASHLGITTQCVKNRLREVYIVTGMDNRVQLTLWYLAKTGKLNATKTDRVDVPTPTHSLSTH